MTKPKWTPGPWRVEGRFVCALKVKTVAEIPHGGVWHGQVDAANAALIAAAPELYEALADVAERGCYDCSEFAYDEPGDGAWYKEHNCVRLIARAALAKARGEA